MTDVICKLGENINKVMDDLPIDSTIILSAGIWRVNLLITRSITIKGADGATLDGGQLGSVFKIDRPGLKVSLNNLEIFNGMSVSGGGLNLSADSEVTIENCIMMGNHASTTGGAISVTRGNLFIENSTFIKNEAQMGGIFTAGNDARVVIKNCIFKENKSAFSHNCYIDSGSNVEFVQCKFNDANADDLFSTNDGIGQDIYITGTLTRQPVVLIKDCVFENNPLSIDMGEYAGKLNISGTICPETFKYLNGFEDIGKNQFLDLGLLEPISKITLGHHFDLLSLLIGIDKNILADFELTNELKPLARLGIIRSSSNGRFNLMQGVGKLVLGYSQADFTIHLIKSVYNPKNTLPKRQTQILLHHYSHGFVEQDIAENGDHSLRFIDLDLNSDMLSSFFVGKSQIMTPEQDDQFDLPMPVLGEIFQLLPFENKILELLTQSQFAKAKIEKIMALISSLRSLLIIAIQLPGTLPLPSGLILTKDDGVLPMNLSVRQNKGTLKSVSLENFLVRLFKEMHSKG